MDNVKCLTDDLGFPAGLVIPAKAFGEADLYNYKKWGLIADTDEPVTPIEPEPKPVEPIPEPAISPIDSPIDLPDDELEKLTAPDSDPEDVNH